MYKLNLLILDNYGTHGHEQVRRWLAKHPRFVLHFIPTSSSWLNLVERWFVELNQKAVRRGDFKSVEELHQAIVQSAGQAGILLDVLHNQPISPKNRFVKC